MLFHRVLLLVVYRKQRYTFFFIRQVFFSKKHPLPLFLLLPHGFPVLPDGLRPTTAPRASAAPRPSACSPSHNTPPSAIPSRLSPPACPSPPDAQPRLPAHCTPTIPSSPPSTSPPLVPAPGSAPTPRPLLLPRLHQRVALQIPPPRVQYREKNIIHHIQLSGSPSWTMPYDYQSITT